MSDTTSGPGPSFPEELAQFAERLAADIKLKGLTYGPQAAAAASLQVPAAVREFVTARVADPSARERHIEIGTKGALQLAVQLLKDEDRDRKIELLELTLQTDVANDDV